MKIKYEGWELMEFDNAKNFRNYQIEFISKKIIGRTAEIGPGNGSIVSKYINNISFFNKMPFLLENGPNPDRDRNTILYHI